MSTHDENLIQGSESWLAARLGRVTASRVADVLAKTKSGYSTSREAYAIELAQERLNGVRAPSFTNDAMRWGTEQEPIARGAYEAHTGEIVEEVGLVEHPTIPMCAASPDGLVGDKGLLEIKNPASNTHLRTLLSGKVDSKYIPQMAWQLACTQREWCDFVSYDSRMPPNAQLFVARYVRDDKYITEIEAEVMTFLEEVEDIVEKIKSYRMAA